MQPTVIPLINREARLALTHAGETMLKFRLGQMPRSLNTLTTLAMVTPEEATFDGYTAGGVAVTWTTGYVAPGDVPSNETQLFSFIMATAVTPNTIYYWWIDDGTKIIMCAQFDAPIPMNGVGSALKVMVEDAYPPGGGGVLSVQVVP